MKKRSSILVFAVLLTASANANAEFDLSQLYVGGGLGYNSIDGTGFADIDNAIGFQGFAGYKLTEILEDMVDLGDEIGFAAEVGYMTTGDFEVKNCSFCGDFSASGLWATAVADYAINDQIKILGRFGLDFGDADGLMFGIGAGYALNEQMTIRAEYVIRDTVNSLQGNFVYYLQ